MAYTFSLFSSFFLSLYFLYFLYFFLFLILKYREKITKWNLMHFEKYIECILYIFFRFFFHSFINAFHIYYNSVCVCVNSLNNRKIEEREKYNDIFLVHIQSYYIEAVFLYCELILMVRYIWKSMALYAFIIQPLY